MRLSLDRAIVHSLLLVSAFAGCREPSGAAPLLVASTTAAPNTLAASWELALDRCNGALARADHAEAERACDDALARSEAFGAGDRRRAVSLHAVGRLREAEGRYAEAEALYRRALAIWEAVDHDGLDVAVGANSVGVALERQGRYDEAATQYERARATFERAGQEADLAKVLNNLGNLYRAQRQGARAEPIFRRALELKEKIAGPDSLDVAITAQNLAVVYDELGRFGEAEALYLRALAIKEAKLGAEHPSVAVTLSNLGAMKFARRDYAAAEPLLRRALAVQEKALGPVHPDERGTLTSLASVLRAMGRESEAATIDERVRSLPATK